MTQMKTMRALLMLSVAGTVLSACGADDIASPGTGGNVTINYPAPTPAPAPAPTPTPSQVTPATGCPTIADPQGLTDAGTITGPTGTYRVCSLPARINRSITLPKIAGLLYQLTGRVDVGTDGGPTASAADSNVTLTIDPGVIVYGGAGVSWLAVNRGNKIHAVGTATQPIIFTSRDNVLGLNTDNSSGQWGGVVLMGRAQITDCTTPGAPPLANGSSPNAGTLACERQTEGAVDPAVYGGVNNADSSGTMDYVQIRYSGYVLSSNNELQSLTTEGIGSGTKLDHIMSFNSSDDGAEFFGGHVHMKHYVSVGAEDDNLDTDTGTKANFQYVIVVQRPGIGDAMIEADSDNSVDADNPRQNTTVANATFIDQSANNSDQASILLRGGTDYSLLNTVMVNKQTNPCLRVSRSQTASTTADNTKDEAGAPIFRSTVFSGCGTRKYIGSSGVTDAAVAALFGTGTNNNNDNYAPSLISIFINGATENAVTPFDASTYNGRVINGIEVTRAGFFDKTSYIGAVKDASDTWYQGWTCNSSTADFGTGGSLCTSLPTN